jgi:ribonucleotide monophosphatase NagD (HAD superfamily)
MKDKLERRRILAIGDAMHTDMKGAQNEKLDALFVTSGIHREELQGMAQGNVLDAAAVRQFAEAIGFIPMAAIPELVW